MAVEPAKIRSMMEGRTLSGDNIRKMYQMVKEAEGGEDTEKKKQVMKHSVFFAGQLPLCQAMKSIWRRPESIFWLPFPADIPKRSVLYPLLFPLIFGL